MDKIGNFIGASFGAVTGAVGKVVESGQRNLYCNKCHSTCCYDCNAVSKEWCGKFGSDGVSPNPASPCNCHDCKCAIEHHQLNIRK